MLVLECLDIRAALLVVVITAATDNLLYMVWYLFNPLLDTRLLKAVLGLLPPLFSIRTGCWCTLFGNNPLKPWPRQLYHIQVR